MGKASKLLILFVMVGVYILIINLIASMNLPEESFINMPSGQYNSMETVGFGDKVEVNFYRDRLLYNMDSQRIYLFNFIALYYMISGVSIWASHALFTVLFLLFFVLILLRSERRYYGE